jgi:hypothetical protein
MVLRDMGSLGRTQGVDVGHPGYLPVVRVDRVTGGEQQSC